jgi:hypothetical protein
MDIKSVAEEVLAVGAEYKRLSSLPTVDDIARAQNAAYDRWQETSMRSALPLAAEVERLAQQVADLQHCDQCRKTINERRLCLDCEAMR